MNAKIKVAGAFCPVEKDYEHIYAALKDKFGEGDDQLFTERKAGYEYLQWELPDDGWISLPQANPVTYNVVKKELAKRKETVKSAFKAQQKLADDILSVPDETYIYFRIDGKGNVSVKLTAWGYKYPERIAGNELGGHEEEPLKKEHVKLYVLNDGKPVPHKSLLIEGTNQDGDYDGQKTVESTNQEGLYDMLDLPIGYKFSVRIDDLEKSYTVEKGDGNIIIDITPPQLTHELLHPEEGPETITQTEGEKVKGDNTPIETDYSSETKVQSVVEKEEADVKADIVHTAADKDDGGEGLVEDDKPTDTTEEEDTESKNSPIDGVLDDSFKNDDGESEKEEEEDGEEKVDDENDLTSYSFVLNFWEILVFLSILLLTVIIYKICYDMFFV